VDKFQSYVKPKNDSHVTVYIQKLTRISQEKVDGAKEFNVVFQDFLEWAGDDSFFITWGVSDKHFFQNEFDIHGIKSDILEKFVDVQAAVSENLHLKNILKLKDAVNFLGLSFSGKQHSAYDDAYNTSSIFCKMMSEFGTIEKIHEIGLKKEIRRKLNKIFHDVVIEKKINAYRYQKFLEKHSLDKLKEMREIFERVLINETKNRREFSSLALTVWQKYVVLKGQITIKTKELEPEEKIDQKQINQLIKCINILFSIRRKIYKGNSPDTKSKLKSIVSKVIDAKSKIRNLKGNQEVVEIHDTLQNIVLEVKTSQYFNQKYKSEINQAEKKLNKANITAAKKEAEVLLTV
jgi:inhibitor of KinA sporulation pathway (predicted exonuclease)